MSNQNVVPKKEAGLAILLSFLFPGAGHLYLGEASAQNTAIAFMAISGANLVLTVLTLGLWILIGFFVWLGTAIYTAIDSNALAARLNAS